MTSYYKNRMTGDSLDGRYNFENGVAAARPEIQSQRFTAVVRPVERRNVSSCEIGYMDEIALASPIAGRVICAENLQRWTAPRCGINCKRYEMSFGIMPLAELTLRISSTRVEIAQQ